MSREERERAEQPAPAPPRAAPGDPRSRPGQPFPLERAVPGAREQRASTNFAVERLGIGDWPDIPKEDS